MKWESILKLSEQNLKDIIKQYVMDHNELFGINVDTDKITEVNVNISERCEGYGPSEHYIKFLQGIDVKIERDVDLDKPKVKGRGGVAFG